MSVIIVYKCKNLYYIYKDKLVTKEYCPCITVIPTKLALYDNYLDVLPTFAWDTLIKDKWFKNIELHYELHFLYGNRSNAFRISEPIYDNHFTISFNDWKKIINEVTNPNYYAYIAMVSEDDPYRDDYYYAESFLEPNRYKNRASFLPHDWNIEGRYYFSNELDSTSVESNPSRMYTSATQNELTINTERLRCGYIEEKYIVLSPRRENAGRAYFEMNFDKLVYSFMYRACMWSAYEQLDGIAIIQIKDNSGRWVTLKDIPLSSLSTKENKLKLFTEFIPEGILGLRFETTATATGNRNKGRFCLGDLVFSTSAANATASYLDYDYII